MRYSGSMDDRDAIQAPEHDIVLREFPATSSVTRHLRICIVTFELAGFWKNGGIGTVSTGLAELLAAAGHSVTVAYTRPEMLSDAELESASRRYLEQGITIAPIRYGDIPALTGALAGFTGWERYAVYRWLATQSFDVVHGSEHLGELVYCIAAKRLGLGFEKTQFWIGCHGSTQWVLEANEDAATEPFWIWTDAAERMSIRGADLLWAPSRYLLSWMNSKRFELPEGRLFLQQYRMPDDLRSIAKNLNGNESKCARCKGRGNCVFWAP